MSFVQSIKDSLRTQTATWFVGAVVAILGVFSSYLADSVKTALYRAETRAKYYEELATDLSDYLFCSELLHEFLAKGWTTRPTLENLITEYNSSIVKFRRKEHVYFAWVQKHWGRDAAAEYASLVKAVKQFDATLHELNDEFEAVNIKATRDKVDPVKADPVVRKLGAQLPVLTSSTQSLLDHLR